MHQSPSVTTEEQVLLVLFALVFLFRPAEKNRLVKNVLLEKEGQKRTAVQKEYDRTRKCAVGVLHFLLRGGLALD